MISFSPFKSYHTKRFREWFLQSFLRFGLVLVCFGFMIIAE